MRFSRVAGLWYAQNATEGAGVQWVVAEVARRTERVLALLSTPSYLSNNITPEV